MSDGSDVERRRSRSKWYKKRKEKERKRSELIGDFNQPC